MAAAWLTGTFIGLRSDTPALPLLLLFLATLAAAPLLRLYRMPLWPLVLTAVLLLALLRVDATDQPLTPLVTKDDQLVTLQGKITNDPESTARRVKFTLGVEAVDRGQGLEPIQAKVLVYAGPPESLVSTRQPPFFRYSDKLLIEGQLQRPAHLESFDYPSYLANRGISGIVFARETTLLNPEAGPRGGWRSWILDLRRELSGNIEDSLPGPQSTVAQALLLGQRGQLPDDVVDDFRSTGTSHLLAISGLHVGVLMVLALAVSVWALGRRSGTYLLIALVIIWLYALVSGMPLSVVRAAVMGSVYLAAAGLGRPRSVLQALAISVAVMVAISPQILEQISFQLSFAAMAGIALALPYQARVTAAVSHWGTSSNNGPRAWLVSLSTLAAPPLIVSAGAVLATWPLVAYNFDRIPVLGIFVTLLALPALPLILAGTLATALVGFLHPALGQFFGWITWVPISYLLELISKAPTYTISGDWVGNWLVWAWYLVLGGVLLLVQATPYMPSTWPRLRRLLGVPRYASAIPSSAISPAATLAGVVLVLAVAGAVLWMQIFSGPDGKLHVYFFDVGQGDSALIVTPTGKQVLVDGGPETDSAIRALAGPMSTGDRSLDMVVLTHLDADHSRGLVEVLDRYRVASVLVGMENPNAALYPQWQASLERKAPNKLSVQAGQRIILDEGLRLEVLNPPALPLGGNVADQNNNGVVLRIVYGEVSFLLAADIEAMAENYLARRNGDIDSTVLKVAHHGSKTSTTPDFFARVDPVVAVGEGNRFNHPHTDVVQRVVEALGHDQVYRTDKHGTVEFVSDGKGLWVSTER